MPDMLDVVVIGSGFGGLFAATELERRGRDVVLVDASERPGGIAETVHEDGYLLEPAAGTFLMPHRALTPLLEHAGVDVVQTEPEAGMRYIWTRGRLAAIPTSPKAILTQAISPRGKLRMAMEPFVRSKPGANEESLQAFMVRRLGREAGTVISHVAASGIYAGDPATLSVAAAFPAIVALEADAGSIARGAIRRIRALPKPRPERPKSRVPVGGMSQAARTLADSLGERYRPNFAVTSITRDAGNFRIEGPETVLARSVVVALRPEAARAILPTIAHDVLDGWPTSPVAVVGLGGTTEEIPLPPGFGYLAGPDVDAIGLGCLFESVYAPGRAARGKSLVKLIVGGARQPEAVDWTDERMVATVVSEMERALGVGIGPSWVRVIRHHSGIPNYDLGHRQRLVGVDGLEATNPGLFFGGWGYRGIGVAHLALNALTIADRIDEMWASRPSTN
jgi:protoporphyrinogen/coproporphyrinogen III oxidase